MRILIVCAAIIGSTLEAKDTNVFHPNMKMSELALIANPATNSTPVALTEINAALHGTQIYSEKLRYALRELLARTKSYSRTNATNRNPDLDATLSLSAQAAIAGKFYLSYQSWQATNGLPASVKRVTEDLLLSSLQKMDWINKRTDSPSDKYRGAYLETLRYYLITREGWIRKDTNWVLMPIDMKR